MIASCLALALASYQGKPSIFQATVSPSKKWAIAYSGQVGHEEDSINSLFDLKTSKSVLVLKGFHGFKGENHGGMTAAYSTDETVGIAMQAGKWEPRALAMFAPKPKIQTNILDRVRRDCQSSLGKIMYSDRYVFDVRGARFSKGTVSLSVIGEIPKQEDTPVHYFALNYKYSIANGKVVLAPYSYKRLSERSSWTWK